MARQVGLPVADFAFVDISEELYRALPDVQKELGMGVAFGSVDVGPVQWLEYPGVSSKVPEGTAKLLLLFDYWIKNADRTQLNPNCLWQLKVEEPRIIDHNLSFDEEFEEASFFVTHLFAGMKDTVFNHLLAKEQLDNLKDALNVFDEAVDELPHEWRWHDLEQTRPVEPRFQDWRALLELCEQDEFWSMK